MQAFSSCKGPIFNNVLCNESCDKKQSSKYEPTWSDTENTSVKQFETNETSLLPLALLITPFKVEITVVVVV